MAQAGQIALSIADVVVVGAGGSGMMAAAIAAGHGLSVILVEKAPEVGGTTAMSVGSIMAAGGRFQRGQGIVDSPAEHARDLDDIRKAMGATDDPELRRLLTENVSDTVDFLSAIGITFLAPLPQPPHTKARLHQAMPTSRAYVFHLEKLCRRRGVDIRTGTRLTALTVEDGRVTGIEAEAAGRPVAFTARRGVILASGDIGGNDALMHANMKNWVEGIELYNPNNTGDGQAAAAGIGGHIVPRKEFGAEAAAHMRFVKPARSLLQQVPPHAFVTRAMLVAMRLLPKWLVRPFMLKFLTTTLGPDRGVYEQGAILVNRRGERFAEELGAPNVLLPAQPDGEAYIVFDERFAKKFSRWPYFISTAPGVAFAFVDDYRRARPDLFHEGRTLEHLSDRMGMVPGRLRAAVDQVNAGRPADLRLLGGRYYALGPLKTWVMIGTVGLKVNTRLEVLREDGSVIPGLYAAGSAAQGALSLTGHGHGLGWAFTSGRLAAESIAA